MIFQHLLPRARAWRITTNKNLRNFFVGLTAGLEDPIKLFYDQIFQDLDPQLTRELDAWESQFGLLNTIVDTQERRDRLDGAWKAKGGQSPRYIQDTLQAAGFDVYVHEWWVPGSEAALDVKAAATARSPFTYLNDNIQEVQYLAVDGGADMQDGDILGTDISSQGTTPWGSFFKNDGTKVYLTDTITDLIYQYSLPTPWSLTGMVYDGISFDTSTISGAPRGIFFKDDGTKFYFISAITDTVYQCSTLTAWSLVGATYDTVLLSLASEDGAPHDIFFKPDGTKIYMVGNTTNSAYQYSLPTPWVLTGASYDTIFFDFTTQDANPRDIFFKPDGTKIFMLGNVTDVVYQYSLPTPWVLTGMSYDTISVSVAAQDTTPQSIFFKDDGLRFFVLGNSSDAIYQYLLPTPWVLTNSVIASLAGDGTSIQPTGYPLVNKIFIFDPDYVSLDGAADMQDGDELAQDGSVDVTGDIYNLKKYTLPIDDQFWPYFLYIGGEIFPNHATLSISRRNEFETLCLKICPAGQWLGILVDYT